MYSVKWRRKARLSLRKLPKDVARRIVLKVNAIRGAPYSYLEKLVRGPGFKLRVGDYRVIIDVIGNVLAIRIVGHRKKVYRRR